jgi:hypothetical protein
MSSKDLPVFITETGWSSNDVPEDVKIKYYDQAFKTVWTDPGIVAITPFLLQAGAGPFAQFSFLTPNGSQTKQYQYIQSIPKTKGIPSYPTRRVLAAHVSRLATTAIDFSDYKEYKRSFSVTRVMENLFDFFILR